MAHAEDLHMPTPTPRACFGRGDLTTSVRLDGPGLEAIGQRDEPEGAVLACRVGAPDQRCR